MKTWSIQKTIGDKETIEDIISTLLANRGLLKKKDQELFLHPKDPKTCKPTDVGIDAKLLKKAVKRIEDAIEKKESIVVYTDYDADGITAGAIMWEALHGLGATIMPYVPHRVDEGYGLSEKGIDAVQKEFHPTLIITVDHGISAASQVAYAKSLGIDVVVTDHHLKPDVLPDCPIVHTTDLCGAGVSWFVVKELLSTHRVCAAHTGCVQSEELLTDLLSLAAIGTIADMVPLVGANRSITKFGLEALRRTKRVGLLAILKDAGASQDQISSYVVSHMITPRLNALGRLEHALDALRLLCTKNKERAEELASKLGLTNKERQKMTFDSSTHAKQEVVKIHGKIVSKKILLIAHESYNQGIIGLVAGKLVEEYYLPSIVLSKGEEFSKASARSIVGFNIVEAIRSFQELLIDVGGHPLAAGFTIETKNIPLLQEKLEAYAELHITEAMLHKPLMIDVEMPLSSATEALWEQLRGFEPFGLGNYEPIFVTREVSIVEVRQIGADGKHLKLKVQQKDESRTINAVAFSMGNLYSSFKSEQPVALAYTIDMNEWNGRRNLQLKIRDIQFS